MATPVPERGQQHNEVDFLDLHLSQAAPTPLRRALLDVMLERSRQIQFGYDAQHDVEHGVEHLLAEAVRRVDPHAGIRIPRADRVAAAALLIASLELDEYEETAR